MRSYDLTPLFRTSIGFDRMNRLVDSALQLDNTYSAYPPYNIAKTGDDDYAITLAVAGFAEGDIEVVTKENTLTVRGNSGADDSGIEYLHRGIAGRSFERHFKLADHIKVERATMQHGLLSIQLVREVPEPLKPRVIPVNRQIEANAAK